MFQHEEILLCKSQQKKTEDKECGFLNSWLKQKNMPNSNLMEFASKTAIEENCLT